MQIALYCVDEMRILIRQWLRMVVYGDGSGGVGDGDCGGGGDRGDRGDGDGGGGGGCDGVGDDGGSLGERRQISNFAA